MTDTTQVTHPPVTHPAPTPIVLGIPQPAAPATNRAERRTRTKAKLPPPQVILAAVLAVAALELLLWQVGGVWWGFVVHAVLAGAVALAALVWVAMRWRGRRSGRAGSPTARSGGTPGKSRNPLSKLFPGGGGKSGRTPGGGKATPGGGGKSGKPGLLARLRPGGGKSPKAGGSPPKSGKPFGGSPGGSPSKSSRNPLARLFPGGGGKSPKPGGGGGSTPGGKGGNGKSGNGQPTRNGKKSNPLADLVKGFRDGVGRDGEKQAAKNNQKPAPAAKSTPVEDAKPTTTTPEKPTQPVIDEQRVKEAVKKAAKVKPIQAATTRGGSTQMGDMNKVLAAAEELAAALKDYEPEDMYQVHREMPHLADVLSVVSGGFRHVASRAESEWPVSPQVVEALHSISEDVRSGADTAETARGAMKSNHETDIERHEAPRKGSHRIEGMWDVGRNQQ